MLLSPENMPTIYGYILRKKFPSGVKKFINPLLAAQLRTELAGGSTIVLAGEVGATYRCIIKRGIWGAAENAHDFPDYLRRWKMQLRYTRRQDMAKCRQNHDIVPYFGKGMFGYSGDIDIYFPGMIRRVLE